MSSLNFVQADSSNLPEVDLIMILEYVHGSRHTVDEIRAVKQLVKSQEQYVVDAIGFVELQRDESKCIVKAKIVPEEDIEQKYYSVSAYVDEKDNTIIKTACDGCVELEGGCTHTLIFLEWLREKSSIHERAPVQCFWHEPLLGTNYSLLAKDIFIPESGKTPIGTDPCNPAVLEAFIEECKKRNITNALTMHFAPE